MVPTDLRTFDEFRHWLSDTLGIAESTLTPEAHFLFDLGIESLKLVELVLQLERGLGRKIPLDIAWQLETVGDAYRYYQSEIEKQTGHPA